MSPMQETPNIPSIDNATTTIASSTTPPDPAAEDWHVKRPSTFQVHHLSPTSPNLAFLAGKFAALRLQALTISPGSFGSRFAATSKRTAADWQAFLKRPTFHTLICSRHELDNNNNNNADHDPEQDHDAAASPDPESVVEQGQWIAHISLLGPIPKSEYDLSPPNRAPESGSDADESKWHLTALWTDPHFRGHGLGTRLTEAAVDFAAKYHQQTEISQESSNNNKNKNQTTPSPSGGSGGGGGGGVKRARVRLMVRGTPENEPILRMYRKMGFAEAGQTSLFEAMLANGDHAEIPGEILRAGNVETDAQGRVVGGMRGGMWHSRNGVCMEVVVGAR